MEFRNITTDEDRAKDLIRYEIREDYVKVGVNGMNILSEPKEKCPNCGREHYGEAVRVYGQTSILYWHGCLACWKQVVEQLPLAFEMAALIETVIDCADNQMSYDTTPFRAALRKWKEVTKET